MGILAYHIREMGWMAWALGWCAVLLAGLAWDRTLALARTEGPSARLAEAVVEHLRRGDVAEALGVASAERGVFAAIAVRILRESLQPTTHLQSARSEALELGEQTLLRRLGYFATLANLATLLGLLGTTMGIAFVGFGGSVPNVDAASRAVVLAHDIADSLGCTFGGLVVAVFALIAHGWFRACVERRTASWRAESLAIVNALVTYRARLRFADQRPRAEPRGYRAW